MKKYLNKIIFSSLIAILLGMFFVPMVVYKIEGSTHYISSMWMLTQMKFSGYTLVVLIPYLFALAALILGIVNEKNSTMMTIAAFLMLISGIVFFGVPSAYFSAMDIEAGNYAPTNYVFGAISILVSLYLASFVFDAKKFSISDMAQISLLIALAIILDMDFCKITIGGEGGSISFTMVPLFFIALRYGFIKGFLSIGIVYGFITCILDGWGLFTFPFDYLLGYGGIAIASLFSKVTFPRDDDKVDSSKICYLIAAVLTGSLCRFVGATISGMVLYGTSLVGSMAYNMPYIGVSMVLTMFAMTILYKPLLVLNKRFPVKM